MKEQLTSKFIVAVPECAKAKMEAILAEIAMEPDAYCLSGGEALELAQGAHALVLTTWKLNDMLGTELAQELGPQADVLVIVPQDYDEAEAEGSGALLLRNPLSQDALYQALRAVLYAQERYLPYKQKAAKLERQLEERKIIDRAKGRLMEAMHLSEPQAHYHIQKKSMDSGRRIVDIAREILEAERLEGAEN